MWRRAIRAIRRRRGAADDGRRAADQTRKLLTDIRWELREQRKYLEAFRHLAARDVLGEVAAFTSAHQLGFEQTMRRLRAERLSFARFGDGEFRIMLRPEFNLRFQPWSAGLAGDLRAVLTMDGFDPGRLLLGFPYPYRNLHWTGVWLDIWHEVTPLLDRGLTYGNSHVSRPVFFQQLGAGGVRLWRDLWAGAGRPDGGAQGRGPGPAVPDLAGTGRHPGGGVAVPDGPVGRRRGPHQRQLGQRLQQRQVAGVPRRPAEVTA